MAVLRGMAILPLLYFSWQKKSIGLPNVDENRAKMPTQNCDKIQKNRLHLTGAQKKAAKSEFSLTEEISC